MRTILTCFLGLLLFQHTNLNAASVPQVTIQARPSTDSSISNNFLNSPSFYKAPKKPGFLQKLEYKIVQKKVKRLLAHRADEPATRKNVLSTIALILGILAAVTLFIPAISVASLIAAPAALITGIIALGKSYNNSKGSRAKAIIGIVLGSIVIAFILAILIWFLSGGFILMFE